MPRQPSDASDRSDHGAHAAGGGATRRYSLLHAVTAVAILIGAYRAWQLRWVCDDAFVSFRYADHLVAGQGLVWNVGERVEGYTNLLWTLLLAGAAALDVDRVVASQALGWLSFVAVLLAAWRLGSRIGGPGPHVPVAVWILVLLEDVLVWATGGLETMTVAALATAMALALFGVSAPSPRRQWMAGVLGGLLVLIRADGALLAGLLALGYLGIGWRGGRQAARPALRTLGVVALLVAGNLLFRLAYYGDWLPNTFYAKSAGHAWWSQGLTYLGLLLARNHVLIWMALVTVGMELLERRLARQGVAIGGQRQDRAAAALAMAALIFGLYVIYSGGDFMFARRLVPILPLVLLAFGRLVDRLGSLRWQLAIAVPLGIAAALPYPLYRRHGTDWRIRGVADERRIYPPRTVAYRRAQGEALGRAFAGIETHFLLEGGLCMVAYYSGLPRFMELNGLTDPVIAKQRIERRGVPGHEKAPPFWWLDVNRVDFLVMHSPPQDRAAIDVVSIDDGRLYLLVLHWNEAVMDRLADRPGVRFVPIDEQLGRVERRLREGSCEQATRAFDRLDHHYLRWHERGSGLRGRLRQRLQQRCAEDRPGGG